MSFFQMVTIEGFLGNRGKRVFFFFFFFAPNKPCVGAGTG